MCELPPKGIDLLGIHRLICITVVCYAFVTQKWLSLILHIYMLFIYIEHDNNILCVYLHALAEVFLYDLVLCCLC